MDNYSKATLVLMGLSFVLFFIYDSLDNIVGFFEALAHYYPQDLDDFKKWK